MAARNQQKVIAVMAIAVAAHVGIFILLTTNQTVYDFFFKKSESSEYVVSASRLNEIVTAIRQHTREKWIEKVREIEVAVDSMDDFRQEHFDKIANGRQGPAYLEDLKRLSRNHHKEVGDRDLADPDVSLEAVYEAAKDAEKRLVNYYRDVVAAKNALKLEVPAIDAVSWVKVVPPKRIPLDKEALDHEVRSRTDGTLDAFKDNVQAGDSEIDAMIKHAEKIMEKAGLEGGGNLDEGWEQLPESAMGSTRGATLLPDELAPDAEGTSAGDFNAEAGRYIGPTGSSNRNLFINKWYVLGPFENRFRSNLDASFMPESVIDLDSKTIGKDGKEISWEYWRRRSLRIEPGWAPRDSVYYGWTEVYVEKAGKYWISTGSDDYGKLWINGELVWKSDTGPKSFRADEFTGEFDLEQGVNEILFRCENHGGTMGWSVIFHIAK